MKSVTPYLLIITLTTSVTFAAAPDSTIQRIIGGEEAEVGAWPFAATLIDRNGDSAETSFFCGGSLIDERWVLTAAHCVYDGDSITEPAIDVFIGAHQLSQAPQQGQRLEVVGVHVHPNYIDSQLNIDNDIALLQLATPSDRAKVALADTAFMQQVGAGTESTVIGWGNRSATDNDFPDSLHQVEVPIVDAAVCQAAFDGEDIEITDNMICAGPKEGGRDSCNGDSGGPHMVNFGDGWNQIGVVSFGGEEGCAAADSYGVYTKVARYQNWIEGLTTGVLARDDYSFGVVAQNSKHRRQITFTNFNDRELATIQNPRLQGPSTNNFAIVSDSCSGSFIGPKETCSFTVELTANTAGSINASFVADTNMASTETLTTVSKLRAVVLPRVDLSAELDNSGITFYSGGDAAWIAETGTSQQGGSSARAGNLSDNQSSYLLTQLTGPGRLTFQWRVSSEEGFDGLQLYVDGDTSARISGDLDWTGISKDLGAGEHDVYWVYSKDEVESAGADTGYIDAVKFSRPGSDNDGDNDGGQGEGSDEPDKIIKVTFAGFFGPVEGMLLLLGSILVAYRRHNRNKIGIRNDRIYL